MTASTIRLDPPARLQAVPGRVHEARVWVRLVVTGHLTKLGLKVSPGWYDDLELLVSEVVTNAVCHSRSAKADEGDWPIGMVTVAVRVKRGTVWVGVADAGSDKDWSSSPPHGLPPDGSPGLTEHGRGLVIVETLSDRWGCETDRDTGQQTVWFELSAEAS